MLSRNWRSNIALGRYRLAAAAVAIAFVVFGIVPTATNLTAQGQRTNEREDASDAHDVLKNMTLLPRVKRRLESKPKIYLPDCTQPKDHNQADLCEQMRMADAAEKTERVGYKQYVVSLWGLAALVGTLLLSIVATRAATRAAVAAERALTDLERPHVFADVREPGVTVAAVPGEGTRFTQKGLIVYRFTNYGRTPARLLDITRRFPVERRPSPSMPDPLPPDEAPDRTLPVGVVAATDHPYEKSENPRAFYGSAFLENDAPLDVQLFFMGRVRYADIFDNVYVVGFCFVFDPIWRRYVRVGDERYNYTRKQRQT